MILRITNITSKSTLMGHLCRSHIFCSLFSVTVSSELCLVGYTRLLLHWLGGRVRHTLTQLLPRPLAINLICGKRLLTRVIFSCFCTWELFR